MQYPNFVTSSNGGNGEHKTITVQLKKNGTPYAAKRHSMPSVRAKITGAAFNANVSQRDFHYGDFEGGRYAFGEDVLLVPSGNESHRQGNRYGNPLHRSLVAYSTAMSHPALGTRKDPHVVDLILYLPPKIYNDMKDTVIERFRKAGTVEIHLKGEDKPRIWEWGNIAIYPEGHIALLGLGLTDKGKRAESRPNILGECLVLDYGAGTWDIGAFINGKVNPEYLHVSTFDDLGIYDNVLIPAAAEVRDAHPDFRTVTPEHIDVVLRNGFSDGDWTFTMGRSSVDCQGTITGLLDRMLDASFSILDSYYNELLPFHLVLVCGGIADYALTWLRPRFDEDRFINIADYPHLEGIHPVWLNAESGLRHYLFDLRGEKKKV